MEHLKVITKLVHAWFKLHNLIGKLPSNLHEGQMLKTNSTTIEGSQVITTMVIRLEKANKPSRVPRTQELQSSSTSIRE
jgi:hypothetical protein